MTDNHGFTSLFDVLDALEAAIAADPLQRATLAKVIDGYHHTSPDTFHWAVSDQAPAILQQLMQSINFVCRTKHEPKRGRVIRLADREPKDDEPPKEEP